MGLQSFRSRRFAAVLAALAALALSPAPAAGDARLHVFAAASLGETIDAIIDLWPGEAVGVYGGSSTLARQIELGAPADVFISANPEWVEHLARAGALRGDPVDIAANSLVVVGAPGVASPMALLLSGKEERLAIADPEAVPAGIYAREALIRLGLWEGRPTLLIGASVREALAWVRRGEAAIGVVYRTDALLAPELAAEPFDPALHAPIRYVAAITAGAGPEAENFLAFLAGPEAQSILAKAGFDPPGAPDR